MNIEDIKALRRLLVAQRDEIEGRGDEKLEPNRQGVGPADEEEQALNEMHQSIASARNRERADQQARIVEAIARLDADPEAFGLCEECDGEIPHRRLMLMPWVTVCVPCQEALDAEAAGARGPTRRRTTDYV